jgi:hypothetical protein
MSHVTDVKMKVKDLDALERAADRLGLRLVRGQTTWKWFGSWQNDFHGKHAAVDQGFDPAQFGKGEHALVRKDAREGDYEIGVVRARDGDGYELLYDGWGSDGRRLEQAAGHHLEDLNREYTISLATQRAHEQLAAEGFEEEDREQLADGRIKLQWVRR